MEIAQLDTIAGLVLSLRLLKMVMSLDIFVLLEVIVKKELRFHLTVSLVLTTLILDQQVSQLVSIVPQVNTAEVQTEPVGQAIAKLVTIAQEVQAHQLKIFQSQDTTPTSQLPNNLLVPLELTNPIQVKVLANLVIKVSIVPLLVSLEQSNVPKVLIAQQILPPIMLLTLLSVQRVLIMTMSMENKHLIVKIAQQECTAQEQIIQHQLVYVQLEPSVS
jgi:hypothetical protein